MLQILFQNDDFVVINKPHGLLVHRSPIAKDASEFAVQILRDQLDRHVYPVHRLDRKTGGLLIFTLDRDLINAFQSKFVSGEITKEYLAIVRGYTDDNGEIDYPLKNDQGKVQEAQTSFETIERSEVKVPFGRHATSRYSLVRLMPKTGRMHQLRKHMAHILHPIIADRPHGCNKQNKLFKEKWAMDTMMLHAHRLSFSWKGEEIELKAPIQSEFERTIDFLGFSQMA